MGLALHALCFVPQDFQLQVSKGNSVSLAWCTTQQAGCAQLPLSVLLMQYDGPQLSTELCRNLRLGHVQLFYYMYLGCRLARFECLGGQIHMFLRSLIVLKVSSLTVNLEELHASFSPDCMAPAEEFQLHERASSLRVHGCRLKFQNGPFLSVQRRPDSALGSFANRTGSSPMQIGMQKQARRCQRCVASRQFHRDQTRH